MMLGYINPTSTNNQNSSTVNVPETIAPDTGGENGHLPPKK